MESNIMRWIETYGKDAEGLEVVIAQNTETGNFHRYFRDTDADETIDLTIYRDFSKARENAAKILGLDS